MKQILFLPFLLVTFLAAAQNLKPIPQMVADAGSDFQKLSLFSEKAENLTAAPEIGPALRTGTVLSWDAAQVQAVRALAGNPLTLTLPMANGDVLALDLVPAKNFSEAFQVHVASTGEALSSFDRGVHFWGIVQGDQESLVAISVFENEVIGTISTADAQYVIGAIPGNREKKHVLYSVTDLQGDSGFTCFTDDELHRIGEAASGVTDRAGPTNCVRMFVETDFTLFQNKGSVANVVTYMTGVFSQVSALYTNETVNVVLHDLLVWDVTDPYTGPSASNYLTQFRNAKNGVYNGDLAHLVGINGLGGVAYLDVLCNAYYGVGYSSINSTYQNVPTYSWTIEVITHEIGHNLGSPHTHACSWNGNNTAIDGCGPTAGYSEGCTAPLPTNGGTVMSYCHLVSGVGINFNNGFGQQPGDRIRNEVYNAACLNDCGGGGGGGGGCTYGAINSNNFDAGWGIWVDGGTDCARISNAAYAKSPTWSIQLRDNTGTSVMTTTNQNWTSYDELTVAFSFITVSFENGEDFWLQISTNGGSSYTTVADLNAGAQFVNGTRYDVSVVIPGPFTANTRLRFRADASADDDQVYIDDVVITGCLQNFGAPTPDRNNAGAGSVFSEVESAGIFNLQVGPNPAQEFFNLNFQATKDMQVEMLLTDLTGRIAMQNQLQANAGDNRLRIQTPELPNGVYIVYLRAGSETHTAKVIVTK